MSKVTVKLNKAGVRELLRSDEMKAALSALAGTVRARCGDGYETDSYTGRNRANASVYAADAKAKADNRKNNTLMKALR